MGAPSNHYEWSDASQWLLCEYCFRASHFRPLVQRATMHGPTLLSGQSNTQFLSLEPFCVIVRVCSNILMIYEQLWSNASVRWIVWLYCSMPWLLRVASAHCRMLGFKLYGLTRLSGWSNALVWFPSNFALASFFHDLFVWVGSILCIGLLHDLINVQWVISCLSWGVDLLDYS